jgi:hypothetical protein
VDIEPTANARATAELEVAAQDATRTMAGAHLANLPART